MNVHNVVSHVVAADLSGKEYQLVKLTATGIDIAASTDRAIGTLMRGNVKVESGSAVGKACDVYLRGGANIAYVKLGAVAGTLSLGAGLIADAANPGSMVASETNAIAIVWQKVTGAQTAGAVVQVLFL